MNRQWTPIKGFDFKEILFESFEGSPTISQCFHSFNHMGNESGVCLLP